MPVKPNFLIVGASRSGTTSLHYCLCQHPDVFMSRDKEPGYFLHGGKTPDAAAYYRMFEPGRGKKAIGEATTLYLYAPESPEWIKRELGPVKIVIMLRNPADRAYSMFLLHVGLGCEDALTFKDALERELGRIEREATSGWPPNLKQAFRYFSSAIYAEQVERYLKVFGAENVKIILADEFYRNPAQVCGEVYAFLGIDPGFKPHTSVKYEGRIPVSRCVQQRLRRIFDCQFRSRALTHAKNWVVRKFIVLNRIMGSKPKVDPALRLSLLQRHYEHIKRLERVLQRDLSLWYKDLPGAAAGGPLSEKR